MSLPWTSPRRTSPNSLDDDKEKETQCIMSRDARTTQIVWQILRVFYDIPQVYWDIKEVK
jgi:hypothetical protein